MGSGNGHALNKKFDIVPQFFTVAMASCAMACTFNYWSKIDRLVKQFFWDTLVCSLV